MAAAPPSAQRLVTSAAARFSKLLPGWRVFNLSAKHGPCTVRASRYELVRAVRDYEYAPTGRLRIRVEVVASLFADRAKANLLISEAIGPHALACLLAARRADYRTYHPPVRVAIDRKTPRWLSLPTGRDAHTFAIVSGPPRRFTVTQIYVEGRTNKRLLYELIVEKPGSAPRELIARVLGAAT
jgi:hypothetical protein